MSRGILVWLLAAVCAGGTALAAVGCGDGDESTAKEEPVKIQAANEPPETFIKRTARLLATATTVKDCDEIYTLNSRSVLRMRCPALPAMRKSMKSFRVVGAESFGTGAVVDYKSGEVDDNAAIVLYVAKDRGWGLGRFGLFTDRSTGTDDESSREGFRGAVDRYLDAVRKRDCKAYTASVLITDTKDEARICRKQFKKTQSLAKLLKWNPKAEPKYQGGNQSYGFFTLETNKPVADNSTIGVLKGETQDGKPAYAVLDVAVTLTVPELRRLRAVGEQQFQQNEAPAPETSPQKKADG